MDVASYFNKLSLIWQEMDLCREIVWNYPCGGVQYSKFEEVDLIYNFLVGLNSKFDLARGRIIGQKLIPSLMEVCSEVWLEKDHTSAMDIVTVSGIDSATFSAKSSSFEIEKQNWKLVSMCEHCKEPWHTKDSCWKLHSRLPNGKKRPPNDKYNLVGLLWENQPELHNPQPCRESRWS